YKNGSDGMGIYFFFSSRRRHTRFSRDWSSDVCSSDLRNRIAAVITDAGGRAVQLGNALADLLHPCLELVAHRVGQTADGAGKLQIGRASCRERGEISGGEVLVMSAYS